MRARERGKEGRNAQGAGRPRGGGGERGRGSWGTCSPTRRKRWEKSVGPEEKMDPKVERNSVSYALLFPTRYKT